MSKRAIWVGGVVVVVFLALVSLVFMCSLSRENPMRFDFVIPWAAFWGVVGGVSSWMYANFARVSDARRDKLSDLAAEIMEKTHRVHRSVRLVGRPIFIEEDFKKALEKYGINESDVHNKESIVFRYRLERDMDLFLEYLALGMKVRIYFGEKVEKIMTDLNSTISFMMILIERMNLLSRKQGSSIDTKNYRKVQSYKYFISALFLEEFPDTKESPGIKPLDVERERLEIFQNILERMDKALSKYIRE